LGPSRRSQLDMGIDFFFSYSDGDAKMSLKTKLTVLGAELPISINVVLKSLKGKMRMILLPFPMAKIGFTFIEKPEMIIDIDIAVGSRVSSLDQLQGTLKKKFDEVIKEKFLFPNVKYIRMPGVPKTDPLGKEVTTKVISIDDLDYHKNLGDDEIISSEETPLSLTKSDSLDKNKSIKKYLHRRKNMKITEEPLQLQPSSQQSQSLEDPTAKSGEESISEETSSKSSLKEKKEKRSIFKKKKNTNPHQTNLPQN